jgi:hypothetical protein
MKLVMETYHLEILTDVKIKEQYEVEISKFCGLENLDDIVDVNMPL